MRFHLISALKPPLFISAFALLSCNSKKNNIVIKAMDASLRTSTQIIDLSNLRLQKKQEEKLHDPFFKEKMKIWYPKFSTTISLSDSIYNYVEGIKNGKKITKEIASRLFEKIQTYQGNLLEIDSLIKKTFGSKINLIGNGFDFVHKDENAFYSLFFKNTSDEEYGYILSSFQNNVRTIEHDLLNFCDSQLTNDALIVESYSAIFVLDKNYVKPGDSIEMIAGMGGFTTKADPSIFVNDKKVDLNAEGCVIYEFKSSIKKGNHYLPVQINFVNTDGKEQSIKKILKYTVTECSD